MINKIKRSKERNNMKRKYLALAMMTTMVLSMTACGSSAPDSAQTAPAEGTEETPAEEA